MYNLAQTSEKQIAFKILSDAVDAMQVPYFYPGNGRPAVGMDTLIKCCTIKVFNLFSSRRTIPDIHFAYRMGYIPEPVHFNTMLMYMRSPAIEPYIHQLYKTLAIPLKEIEINFSVDSTGFGTFKKVWVNDRLDTKQVSDYKKLHVVSGNLTHIITAAKATDGNCNDSPYFKGLVDETGKNFYVGDVCADKGYISRENCNAVEMVGGTPYIMPKINVRPIARGSIAWRRMVNMFLENEDLFLEHYHQRSNVESVFSAMKRKFLPYVRCRTPSGQRNELLFKVVCHNLSVLVNSIFELNIKPKF